MTQVLCSSPIARLAFAVPMLVGCLLFAGNAGAHLFLTTETLRDALERIGERHAAIAGQGTEVANPEALYRLGEAARELAELMNEQVRAHGLGEQALMTEGIERAKAFGVDIAWSDDHQRFFYDGDAYRGYLQRAPDGPLAADSRYRLIELDFYLGPSDSIDGLEENAEGKREFLESYPDYPVRARIGIFLGIDYRDLYRLCLERDDADCEDVYARLAIEQFRKIASEHADSDSDDGELAMRLLSRTQSEIESQPR
ncbi:MAG: hypothetical protein ACREQZ_07590 [Woeseiaceae bacterium]